MFLYGLFLFSLTLCLILSSDDTPEPQKTTVTEYKGDDGSNQGKPKTTVGLAFIGSGLAVLVIGAIVSLVISKLEQNSLTDRTRLEATIED